MRDQSYKKYEKMKLLRVTSSSSFIRRCLLILIEILLPFMKKKKKKAEQLILKFLFIKIIFLTLEWILISKSIN